MLMCKPRLSASALAVLLLQFSTGSVHAEMARSVESFGVTWTFDQPHEVGYFVSGSPWVVGPVTIVKVDPAAGPSQIDHPVGESKSLYGAVSLRDDKRMRNGSMVLPGIEEVGGDPRELYSTQAYDSRPKNYDPAHAAVYPYRLEAGRALISTISSETINEKGVLATPNILNVTGMFLAPETGPLALSDAAILTCVDRAPPADAFRPAYIGRFSNNYYRASQLQRDLLPKLAAHGPVPEWAAIERQFERPWLDHFNTWLIQNIAPGRNQPAYGRENARINSIAAVMLMLDVPDEQKEQLLVNYVQFGIDLAGLAQNGRLWFSDGGHWQGRKWPILFASVMLDAPELRDFPEVNMNGRIYGPARIAPSKAVPKPKTLFQEDLDTYYGKGGEGQTVLWQIVLHGGPKPTYEEKPRADFTEGEHWMDGYRFNNAASAIGVALAAQQMKVKAIWNHDAFFDYMDRWMSPEEKWAEITWLREGMTRSLDPFVEAMWYAHRPSVPGQPRGRDNLKWVWDEDEKSYEGYFVPNPPVSE